MIFDTHAHYDDEAFEGDREEILARFPEAGIGAVVDVAATLNSIPRVLALAERHDGLYAAAGVHPSECAEMKEEDLGVVREALRHPKTVAIGEIGLDYHWDTPDRSIQKRWFLAQLQIAKETGKPVIIHSRDAAEDTMEILRGFVTGTETVCGGNIGCGSSGDRKADSGREEACGRMKTGTCCPGVIHCYSYSVQQALEYVKMGFYIGVGGVVTFKNARRLKEVVRAIPLESIVLETDCPYMAPEPHRGERNSSLFLPYVVREIAALRNIAPETVEETTWRNARRLYRLDRGNPDGTM